jgi:hypothetical protein
MLYEIFDSKVRVTMGLRKENRQWLIGHEHHSYPIELKSAMEENIQPARSVFVGYPYRRISGRNIVGPGPSAGRQISPSSYRALTAMTEQIATADILTHFPALSERAALARISWPPYALPAIAT